ncbi:hypothetical protein WMY93_012560 [Mugilogobius chulae]|uniref:Solute carrier family 22 member 18 n=1 Tax=Mugilogobius chulae TaxID=88201 RepID=A0AAW0P124_9GOBI
MLFVHKRPRSSCTFCRVPDGGDRPLRSRQKSRLSVQTGAVLWHRDDHWIYTGRTPEHKIRGEGDALVGAAGSLFNLLLVLKFIPKTTKAPNAQTKTEGEKKSLFNLSEITRLLKYPGVAPTFMVKIVAGLPSGIFQVMFSIIALDVFKLNPQENGYLMAFFGISQMVIQGAVIGPLTARFKEASLLLMSICISALVGLGQAYMQNVLQFCFTSVPMMFSLSVFNVITDSMLTKSVPASDSGTMLGLCAAVQSLLRTVGPTLGGFLYVNGGVKSIGLTECVVNAVVFAGLLLRPLSSPDLRPHQQ